VLAKGVMEVYGEVDMTCFLSGLQLPVDCLQRVHFNIGHADWCLQVSRDAWKAPFSGP